MPNFLGAGYDYCFVGVENVGSPSCGQSSRREEAACIKSPYHNFCWPKVDTRVGWFQPSLRSSRGQLSTSKICFHSGEVSLMDQIGTWSEGKRLA